METAHTSLEEVIERLFGEEEPILDRREDLFV